MNEHFAALLARAITFQPGTFDGYPSMSASDETLIFEAAQAHQSDDLSVFLAFFLSENVDTVQGLINAKAFYDAYVRSVWVANMIEGQNAIYELQGE